MIKEKFGSRLDDWIRTAFPFLFKRSLNPNAFTLFGALISVFAAVALSRGAFVAGGLLILMGGFFDLVDGVVARHQGASTRFGAFLDSTVDRFVDMALFLGIALHFAHVYEPGGVLLAGVASIATVLVSYSKACAERITPPITVGVMERGERVGLIAAGAITGWIVPALWVVTLGSAVTVVQRCQRAYRAMEQLDAEERAGLGGQA